LCLTYLIPHDNLQFHRFSCKSHHFIFLYGWIIFHGLCVCICTTYTCVYVIFTSYFLYLFITHWASLLIPQFGYCKQSCNKHGYAGTSLIYWFTLPQMYAQEWHGSHKARVLLVFWGTSTLISIVVVLVYIPTIVYKSSFFPTSSPAFVVCFLDVGQYDWVKMKS
jgi:hypothetical protein